jgi:putative transposase
VSAVAAKRECVRQLQTKGLSERQACRLTGISTSVLCYQPRTDANDTLHNRLRHEGWTINVKRTWRIYREEGLAVRKRRRKKLPVAERQPLVRPEHPNEVWSMDFVFDELASGRKVIGCCPETGRHRMLY